MAGLGGGGGTLWRFGLSHVAFGLYVAFGLCFRIMMLSTRHRVNFRPLVFLRVVKLHLMTWREREHNTPAARGSTGWASRTTQTTGAARWGQEEEVQA